MTQEQHIHTPGPWKFSGGEPVKQSNFGRYKTSVTRGEGMAFETVLITADKPESAKQVAKIVDAAPEAAAELERVKADYELEKGRAIQCEEWAQSAEARAEKAEQQRDALLGLLRESQEYIGGDWRQRRDAAISNADSAR